MPSSHLILCRPLLLLLAIPPSIRVFSNESTLRMRWPKYWSFSFSIIPSKEIPGLMSFRMDCLDLLEIQGTRKSLLQHHSSKTSKANGNEQTTRETELSIQSNKLVFIRGEEFITGGNVKWCNHFRKQVTVSLTVNHTLTAISLLVTCLINVKTALIVQLCCCREKIITDKL